MVRFSAHLLLAQYCGGGGGSVVFSPILFNIYPDELIKILSVQGLGCHLHGQFVGVFIYADDVTLLALTRITL